MNSHRQRRSLVGMPHKIEGVQAMPMGQPDGAITNRSPLSQPTTASHLSSPATTATKSPNFIPHTGAVHSPNFGPIGHQQPMRQPQQPPRSSYNQIQAAPQRPSVITQQQSPSGISNGGQNVMAGSTSGGSANYYPSPFQSHMDQLGKLSRPLAFLRHRTLFVLDSFREYRAGVRCASRYARRARPVRSVCGPRPLPEPVWSTAAPAAAIASRAAEPEHAKPERRLSIPCLDAPHRQPRQLPGCEPHVRSLRPDARCRSIRPLCQYALPDAISVRVKIRSCYVFDEFTWVWLLAGVQEYAGTYGKKSKARKSLGFRSDAKKRIIKKEHGNMRDRKSVV